MEKRLLFLIAFYTFINLNLLADEELEIASVTVNNSSRSKAMVCPATHQSYNKCQLLEPGHGFIFKGEDSIILVDEENQGN